MGASGDIASSGEVPPRREDGQAPGAREVLKDILARECRGLRLNRASVLREDRPLYNAILRVFRTWDDAMRAAGLDPDRVRHHRRWSRQAVIQRIRQLAAEGRPLNCGAIQRIDAGLANVAIRLFDSWGDALEAAGVDSAVWKRRVPAWTRETVIAAIKAIREEGGKLNHAAVRRMSLSHSAVCLFGSWDSALDAAGIDPKKVRLSRRAWTAETLIQEIQRKHRAGEPVNAKDVSPSWIRRSARRIFGSWNAALEAAGLDPDEIRKDWWRG